MPRQSSPEVTVYNYFRTAPLIVAESVLRTARAVVEERRQKEARIENTPTFTKKATGKKRGRPRKAKVNGHEGHDNLEVGPSSAA